MVNPLQVMAAALALEGWNGSTYGDPVPYLDDRALPIPPRPAPYREPDPGPKGNWDKCVTRRKKKLDARKRQRKARKKQRK